MIKEKVRERIFDKINNSLKGKMQEQSIRNAISGIHKKFKGVTINAAAHLFAEKYGVNVWCYLEEKDIESLRHLPQEIFPRTTQKPTSMKKMKKVKFISESSFLKDATKNSEIYPYVYVLENELRNLIFKKFEKITDWWEDKKLISDEVREYAEKVKKAESKYKWLPERANHPLFYIGLEQLFKIIERNWDPYFKNVFNDSGNLRTWGMESVPIRHLIAHTIPTREIDKMNIKIKTNYILNCIKNTSKP